MTSTNRTDNQLPAPPAHTPRLRLKPKAPHVGFVDGAWWPHSADLSTELPDLLAVLSARLGTVDRVVYQPGDWTTAAPTMALDAHSVRLDGHRLQPPNTIEVHGPGPSKIVLLVVAAHTDEDRAHATMMAAANPDDDTSVDGLLTVSVPTTDARAPKTVAQTRWEDEGGSLPE